MFQKVLYYSGFIFSCYAFVFILWQNQAYKFQRFKFHAFFCNTLIISSELSTLFLDYFCSHIGFSDTFAAS